MSIDVAKRLEEEVERHNDLVDIRDEANARAAQAEAERQIVRGRIEVLNELAEGDEEEAEAEAPAEAPAPQPEKDS